MAPDDIVIAAFAFGAIALWLYGMRLMLTDRGRNQFFRDG